MKKHPLLITFLVLAFAVAAYFLYSKLFTRSSLTAWDIIPSETVLVYEPSPCVNCMDEIKNSPITDIIKRAVYPTDGVDSLSQLMAFLTDLQDHCLVSVHLTTRESFDLVFYRPYNGVVQTGLNTMLSSVTTLNNIKMNNREFNGIQINEITYKKTVFSWVVIDNTWVGSFTPVLIEDVIRTYTDQSANFRASVASVYSLPRIKNDGGNLYINVNQLNAWFALFTKEKMISLPPPVGQSALLDLKWVDGIITLNGFTVNSSSQKSSLLNFFSEQTPIPFSFKQVIPNQSLMFVSYGISDGEKFNKKLLASRTVTDSLAIIGTNTGTNIHGLLNSFSGEIGISWVENKQETTSKVILINNKSGVSEWLKTFNTISQKLSIDTVFYEKYGEYDIMELPVFRFPEKLLSPLVTGFDHAYYTSANNNLFIADDLEILKKFIDDIDKEDTWGKSVSQNNFLESTLLEGNFNVFINTPRVWNAMTSTLHPKWQSFIKDNQNLINTLGMGCIQFSHLNESYYTNVSWALKSTPAGKQTTANAERFLVNFSNGIHHLAVVKNHLTKTDEALVQDSSKTLSLLSQHGKIVWKTMMEGFISGDVLQIDYLNNGKLQYFFATPGQLHVIDRLGNYVKPYPVAIGESNIQFVNIVDYDHSKKYRFLISGENGKLWMYDKEGNNLEGWQPRIIDERLSTSARHHRILGKDYIFAVRADGLIYVMNRRGELVNNYPVDLDARLSGDYFVERGKTRSTTIITVVSRDGTLIKFNLDGKVQSREILVKNTLDSKFFIVTEKNLESFLVVRQEAKQLTVYDSKLSPLINSDYFGNNPIDIHYENFGNGRNFITITDKSQDLSFVYNAKGNLLTPLPIDSYYIKIKPSETADKMYYFNANRLSISDLAK